MKSMSAALSMLIRENFVRGSFDRRPEESLVMDGQEQVDAWHQQGKVSGPITPIYHLNARACSRLAPLGSSVIDLGCGSGQFAAYLARQRPDLKIVGIDLSAPMVEMGNQALHEAGLGQRVELRQGDMTNFSGLLPPEVGLINCLFAIHHLPTMQHVESCFREIRDVMQRSGCNLMMFDLARPRHEKTAWDYPAAFSPNAPEAFRADSVNSLIAAYSHLELAKVLQDVFGTDAPYSTRSRLLPLYQAFWSGDKHFDTNFDVKGMMTDVGDGELSVSVQIQYRALRFILGSVPT